MDPYGVSTAGKYVPKTKKESQRQIVWSLPLPSYGMRGTEVKENVRQT